MTAALLPAVQAAYLDQWDRGVPDPGLCRLLAGALREVMGDREFGKWQLSQKGGE